MAETIIFGGFGNSKIQVDNLAARVREASLGDECVHGETEVDASRKPGGVFNKVHGSETLSIIGYSKGVAEAYKALNTIDFNSGDVSLSQIYLIAPPVDTSSHRLAMRAAKIAYNLAVDTAHHPEELRSNRLHAKYLLGELTVRSLHHANSIREVSRFDTVEAYSRVADKLQVPITMGVMKSDELFSYKDSELSRIQAAGVVLVELDGYHPEFFKRPVETLQRLGYYSAKSYISR